jgi:hypothetical protein
VLGILFVVSYLTLGLTVSLAAFLAALAMLTFIVLYDIRHTIVPWESSLLLFIFSLCFALLQMKSIKSFESILFTAFVIAIGFFLLYFFSRGRAMGLGDAPVAFSLSLLVGSAAIPGILFSFWCLGVEDLKWVLRCRLCHLWRSAIYLLFLHNGILFSEIELNFPQSTR